MRTYSRAEAAEILDVTVRTVDNYVRDGVLEALTQTAKTDKRPRIRIPHKQVTEVKAARERLKLKTRPRHPADQ